MKLSSVGWVGISVGVNQLVQRRGSSEQLQREKQPQAERSPDAAEIRVAE